MGVYWCHPVHPSVRPSHIPSPLCGSLPISWLYSYVAQIQAMMGRCVVYTLNGQQVGWFRLYENHIKLLWGPFYWHRLTLISACISDYIHYNVWDEITYPFPNFNGRLDRKRTLAKHSNLNSDLLHSTSHPNFRPVSCFLTFASWRIASYFQPLSSSMGPGPSISRKLSKCHGLFE